MSHGHKHDEYRQEALKAGGTNNGTKGLYVLCDGEAPKSGNSMRVNSRIFCASNYYEGSCETCENNRFTITFQSAIGKQQVACPRWNSPEEKTAKKKPFYVHIERAICLLKSPFEYCSSCPNKMAELPPIDTEGWWEEERARHGTVYR